MRNIKLNDGNSIPAIGFGVFLVEPNGPTYDAVKDAIRALDTGKGTHDPEAPGVGENLATLKVHD